MFEISVIICSYNPHKEYLERALNALKVQSLSYEKWQLLLVDNASEKELSTEWDLSWHPNAKHIRENNLGLTYARIKGIESAEGKLLVFVDDDNILAADFLETSLIIASLNPFIGAFGGKLIGEFEIMPPAWLKPYQSMLAVRDVERNVWSNLYQWETTPAGAGMVIKAEIARIYAQNSSLHPLKKMLGRKGNNTLSGEDGDMVFTAIDMGFGSGRFKELSLIHIIPKQRLEEKYLLKLYDGILTSKYILEAVRTPDYKLPQLNPFKQMLFRMNRLLFKSNIEFKLGEVKISALKKARKILRESKNVSDL